MRINYDSVRAEARKLQNVAAECDASAQVCQKYQNELSVYWEGNAANAYMGGLGQLHRKNKALAEQIRNLSQQIVAVANDMEESDRRLAAQIAQRNAAVKTVAAAASIPTPTPAKKPSAAATVAKSAVPKTKSGGLEAAAKNLINALFGKR